MACIDGGTYSQLEDPNELDLEITKMELQLLTKKRKLQRRATSPQHESPEERGNQSNVILQI